ncbi:MAG: hypothetical protein ACXWQR_20920 [Ktedonobacterales bacterium]
MILEFKQPTRCARCKARCAGDLCPTCADDWTELRQVTDCLPYDTWLTIPPNAGLVITFEADGDHWRLDEAFCNAYQF